MPWSVTQADTEYDSSHPWDSRYNNPEFGILHQGPREQALMAQAEAVEQPGYPEALIRESMTAGAPAGIGPAGPQPTIESVLDGSALQPRHLHDRAPTDFSGTPAGIEASSVPSVPAW